MKGINKVSLLGHLGDDPVLKTTASGDVYARFSLATGEIWRDRQSGERREKTEWHRIICWQKLAEIAGEYCHKGSRVHISGKLETTKYTDGNGIERYTTQIIAEELLLLDPPKDKPNTTAKPYPSPLESEDDSPF